MTATTRERNMRRILLAFALICFLLAAYLFIDEQQLGRELQVLTSESRGVEQNPYPVRKQLRRTRILMWASLGATVLLLVSAAATGSRRGAAKT